jgi:hypothetical protein
MHQRGVGRCPREVVELTGVDVRNPVAPASCFEPCRAQKERPQAKEGIVTTATVAGESVKPRARLFVADRPAAAGRRRSGHGRVRAPYDLRRRPREGRARFQTSCFFARPDAISRSATLSATRTLVYVS